MNHELLKNYRWLPEKFNVSLIEVVDLTKRISYAIKEVDIERLELGEKKLRLVTENTTFEYKWVELYGCFDGGGIWDLTYVGNMTYKAYLTFINYRGYADPAIGVAEVYEFYPMERELVEEYLKFARLYSLALAPLGINIIFEVADPEIACIYPKGRVAHEDFIRKGEIISKKIDGIDVITVAHIPFIRMQEGFYDNAGQVVGIRGSRFRNLTETVPSIFLHELGHALTLDDIYPIRFQPILVFPEPHMTLFYNSIWISVAT